ncbi:MAG: flagellar M-ring protein FliF [Caldimicrobium thiodismutans]|jgi:flagellar M-ring protein FliF|uniref:Flagellar M-ring protein n=1 Tax=Caldimicrobium thiodismutans TaxID=1653476 RepID=A0A2N7PKG9_9BACT|nr:MAG: flagellar M-ring protein FliF [Caldimicrobium thiodismutans]
MPSLNFRNLLEQLREIWNKLTPRQKAIYLGGALGLTLLIVSLIWYTQRVSYGLLYSGLDETTSGQIVQYLKEQKIPYKVGKDGSIYVPEEKVPEIRMEIASKGLLGGTGPGFELFDKEKLGLTEFQEKVNYQRALEGELARTIKGIKGVKSVRVHLALPKESIFLEEEKPPKASVLLELKPGYTLTPDQVKGIINLVSGAVAKLEPKNVSVIDAQTGKRLNPINDEEGLSLNQLAYKRKVEENLKNKIEEMLSQALGYGKAIAQVTVEMSFDNESIKEEVVNPEQSAVISEDLEEENRQTTSPQEGGVAGVKGALTEKFEATGQAQPQGESYSKKRVVRNYEVSKKIRNLEISPGSIKRISVAVLVDKRVLSENDTAKIEWVENLVKGAIGYNPERGDEVKVEAKTFIETPTPKPGIVDYIGMIYKPLIILVALALLYFLVIRPLLKSLKPAQPEAVTVPEVPPAEKLEAVVEEEEEVLPKEIALGIIRSQPERAAALVKKWLLEESLEERKKALAEAK